MASLQESRPRTGGVRAALPRVEKDKLKDLNMLGNGGFGDVYGGYHEEWGRVAVKKLQTTGEIDTRYKKLLSKEAGNLYCLRHPNIVLLMGIVMDGNFNAIIMEYMTYGALNKFLGQYSVPWEIQLDIICDIVLGMNFLHTRSPAIIHCDLKASNVLVGKGLTTKIGDFGLSEWRSYSNSHTKNQGSQCGTVSHIPPESWSDINIRASVKFDVYAFGILLWEVLTGREPFHGKLARQIEVCVCKGQRPSLDEIPEDAPSVLKSLMEQSWVEDPESRPTFQEIKEKLEGDNYRDRMNMEVKRAEFLRTICHGSDAEADGNPEDQESIAPLPHITSDVAQAQSTRAHTDGRQDFRNKALFTEVKRNTDPYLAAQARPAERENQERRRQVLPDQPAGANDYGRRVNDSQPEIHSLHINDGLPEARDGPETQSQTTEAFQSLRTASVGLNPHHETRHRGLPQRFVDRNLDEDGIEGLPSADVRDDRGHTGPEQDVEHDAVPSLPSPQSPNVEFPTAADIPQGRGRGPLHGSPSTTSLPPPYSADSTFNIPTPMNVGIGSAQPVLVHEREGHGITTIYNTGGENKGYIQIGDGNSMVVNPPTALGQPRPRPKPPKGKQPTKSGKMITDGDVWTISKELGNYWKALGYKLGFKRGELDALKHDNHLEGLEEIIRQMLWAWKQKLGKKATQTVLAHCLWEIDQFNLSLKIRG